MYLLLTNVFSHIPIRKREEMTRRRDTHPTHQEEESILRRRNNEIGEGVGIDISIALKERETLREREERAAEKRGDGVWCVTGDRVVLCFDEWWMNTWFIWVTVAVTIHFLLFDAFSPN
jgi:hypothetical protein